MVLSLLCQWIQPGLLEAREHPGEIQQVEISDSDKTTIVHIKGHDLSDCESLLLKDPKAQLPPKLYLTFYNTTIADNAQGIQSGTGAVLSVEVSRVSKKPTPIAQVVINLAADVSTQLKKRDGYQVDVDKKGLSTKVDAARPLDSRVPVAAPIRSDQAIAAGDSLYIAVSPAEELSKDMVVDQEGKLSIPLVGAVQVTGLTADQLAKKLTAGLAKYVTNPKVDVFIKQSTTKQISITGQVNTPGVYPYHPNVRLLDLVSMAGGFTASANKKLVRVLRGAGAERRVILMNVADVLASGDATKDLLLEPGDIVEISRGANGITIFGQVEHPGSYDFIYDMRMLDLMSLCSGFKESANIDHITLFRGEYPNQKIIRIRFNKVLNNHQGSNIALQPGDVVYVPQNSLWTFSTYANLLTPVATLVLAAATISLATKK